MLATVGVGVIELHLHLCLQSKNLNALYFLRQKAEEVFFWHVLGCQAI